LLPLLERAHDGRTEHVGRQPGVAGPARSRRTTLTQLRLDMDRAVEAEEYELAAKLRDQIKALSNVED